MQIKMQSKCVDEFRIFEVKKFLKNKYKASQDLQTNREKNKFETSEMKIKLEIVINQRNYEIGKLYLKIKFC